MSTDTLIERVLHPKSNIEHVVLRYIREIGPEVTEQTLRKAVEEHLDYLSLLAISDVLERFGAETVAARLSGDQHCELDQPYITQIRLGDEGEQVFTVVRPEGDKQLSYLHPEKHRWILATVEEFAKLFPRVVLVAVERASEADYEKDYEVFSKKYPMNGKLERQGEKLATMRATRRKLNLPRHFL